MVYDRCARKLETMEERHGISQRWEEGCMEYLNAKTDMQRKAAFQALHSLHKDAVERTFLKELLRKYSGKFYFHFELYPRKRSLKGVYYMSHLMDVQFSREYNEN